MTVKEEEEEVEALCLRQDMKEEGELMMCVFALTLTLTLSSLVVVLFLWDRQQRLKERRRVVVERTITEGGGGGGGDVHTRAHHTGTNTHKRRRKRRRMRRRRRCWELLPSDEWSGRVGSGGRQRQWRRTHQQWKKGFIDLCLISLHLSLSLSLSRPCPYNPPHTYTCTQSTKDGVKAMRKTNIEVLLKKEWISKWSAKNGLSLQQRQRGRSGTSRDIISVSIPKWGEGDSSGSTWQLDDTITPGCCVTAYSCRPPLGSTTERVARTYIKRRVASRGKSSSRCETHLWRPLHHRHPPPFTLYPP